MSTSAYIGKMTDEGYLTRRLNFDGDPEIVITALNRILQRDGYELTAQTILEHGEWRELDPLALEPADSDKYATVVGYGQVYLPDTVPEDEKPTPIVAFNRDEYAYLLNVETQQVLFLDIDGSSMEWSLGNEVPSGEHNPETPAQE